MALRLTLITASFSALHLRAQAQVFRKLHTFTGGKDGGKPAASVVFNPSRRFYSTTELGGEYGYGTVFQMAPPSKETVIYNFGYPPDGEYPVGPVILDAKGNLYGTTSGGGTIGAGTIFKLDKNGVETILYNFTGGKDGGFPTSGLLLDAQNNLYGVTSSGGDLECNYPNGCGVVFKLDGEGKLDVLHTFSGLDGATPNGPLVTDSEGSLYGTTVSGGSSVPCPACKSPGTRTSRISSRSRN